MLRLLGTQGPKVEGTLAPGDPSVGQQSMGGRAERAERGGRGQREQPRD
jgi:hypothetical protein